MKLLLPLLMIFPLFSHAQELNVNKIKAGKSGTTTIEIRKNAPTDENNANEIKWQVVSGRVVVVGDDSATRRDAKAAWKTACKNWQKEFRQDNKANQIIAISCGMATCDGEVGSMSCSSHARYKIKTRLN